MVKESLFLLSDVVGTALEATRGRGPLMMMKDSFFLLISNVFGIVGPEGGPLMMMKDFSFLLISNVLGSGSGPGGGPTNDGEAFSVSAHFRCFSKGMWAGEGIH